MVIATATFRNDLVTALAPLADEMTLDWSLHDSSEKLRVLTAVSKFGHCLVELIHKAEIGQLPTEIVGVVSNNETMRKTVEWYGLPYHSLPTSDGKAAQEAAFLDLIAASSAELTVLAC
jgi:formyltetrahydrofolate deformylase